MPIISFFFHCHMSGHIHFNYWCILFGGSTDFIIMRVKVMPQRLFDEREDAGQRLAPSKLSKYTMQQLQNALVEEL